MKGLLLKDFINQKSQLKIYLFILVFWVIVAYINKGTNMMPIFFTMLALISTINAVAYDDRGKFNSYAVCMPISKFEIVFTKYLCNFIVTVVGIGFSFVVYYIISGDFVENLLTCLAAFSASLIFAAIILPIIFKFGLEKARIAFMLVGLVPILAVWVFSNINLSVAEPTDAQVTTAISFLPVAALAISFISVFISEKIYKNKEF